MPVRNQLSPAVAGLINGAIFVAAGALVIAMWFNNFDAYGLLFGMPPHVTLHIAWTWRILAGLAFLMVLTGLIWSLVRKRTRWIGANSIAVALVLIASVMLAVPSNPLVPTPADLGYCSTDGRHDCP